jgi:prenyltransferase beta subunit
MLKAASQAKISLGNRAQQVAKFIIGQLNEDGGFKDRVGKSDLYYTVFGIETLLALEAQIPRAKIISYLTQFGQGQSLDFVHLACLVRCWRDMSCPIETDTRDAIARRIETHLAEQATIYTCFLALGAYQDLGVVINSEETFLDRIGSLRCADGGYANESGIEISATPVTAAAVTILHHFSRPVPDSTINWLLSCVGPEGGFCVMPKVAAADLLSTATALHALSGAGAPLVDIRQRCLDFINELWDDRGGFCGSSADKTPDCEYTYYALLAMGHLR